MTDSEPASTPPVRQELLLGKLAVAHVSVMLFFASWVCGGNLGWARTALAAWAGLGPVLTLLALVQPGQRPDAVGREVPGDEQDGLHVSACS